MTERTKNSLVLGGLTSSAGIFLTKVIGLLYVVPFTALATEANLSYYARAYNIYDILLNISLAGIPFGVATMVAKYQLQEKYKTLLLVRKLSTSILALFGFVAMILLIMFALPIAQFTVSGPQNSIEVLQTKNVLVIISFAVFTVPLLSSYRGFYQGLKEFNLYASSQVLEQVVRVTFLLSVGFILVVLLRLDAIWAVYAAILSTSIAAAISIIQFVLRDLKVISELKAKSINSIENLPSKLMMLKEIFAFSTPFLINIFLNSFLNFTNLFLFNRALIEHGNTLKEADLYFSMVMFTTNKLTSIPQIIAPGFVAAIIPFITIAYEKKDFVQLKAYVDDILLTVFYLSLPISYVLFSLSTPIYYVMYGHTNLVMGSSVLKLNSLTGLSFNLAAVTNALVLSIRLRKQNIISSSIIIIISALLFYPILKNFGYSGSIMIKFGSQMLIFVVNLILIARTYTFKFFHLSKKILVMFVGIAIMQLIFLIFQNFGLDVIDKSRFIGLFQLTLYVFTGFISYVFITALANLPQDLFHIDLNKILNKIFHAS